MKVYIHVFVYVYVHMYKYVCMCIYIHIYTQWNVSQSLIKKRILPFVTTWMEPEGIVLSKISQRKTNIVFSHIYVKSTAEFIDTES